jgi:gephyrin
MIEVDEAIKIVLTEIKKSPIISSILSLEEAKGHVISTDILCEKPFPEFPTSIMDGYAVFAPLSPGIYRVQSHIFAGDAVQQFDTTCISYITTGSRVPEGANAVVMVEDTELQQDGTVLISVEVKPNENIRAIGSDIRLSSYQLVS